MKWYAAGGNQVVGQFVCHAGEWLVQQSAGTHL